jgi:pilus assembly protein CpaC
MRKLATILCEICVAAVLLGAPFARAIEAPAAAPAVAAGAALSTLVLQSGSGKVLSLRGSATNIFVADPKVAEVRPASATTLFIFGVAPGQTTVAAMDNDGHVLVQYNLTVEPSNFGANSAQAMIKKLLPATQVQVHADAKGLLLTGSVSSPSEAAQAVSIARQYAGDQPNVDNEMTISSPMQVTLNVRIAEMSREVVRNLGINWSAIGNIGNIGMLAPALQLSASTTLTGLTVTGCPTCRGGGFLGVIDALAQDNLAHVLAEPNLTVMSGQAASFQVGGEYPIPVAGGANGQITVTYKDYGVLLNFLPTVLSDGRINLHVKPEVSELSVQNAAVVASGSGTLTIPALVVRRAETTVELGSGQSFAIAGLLQQDTSDAGSGLPGAGDIPILGTLFHDDHFQRTESELVVVVTAYIVRPVNNPAALRLPTDNYTPPTDLERLLLMRQVATNLPPVPIHIPGDAGFVVQ